MRTTRLLLLVALALAACAPPPPPARPAPPARGASRATPAVKASVTPPPGPEASPSVPPPAEPPATAEPALLRPPAGAHRVLAGAVTIDAPYALGTGLARLVSDASGSVLRVGAGLVSDQGGNLIANHGAGLVANHGAGLAAGARSPWRLRQAGEPPVGALLPAAGVIVAARRLTSGEALPLGEGPDGRPAYAIRTDAQGRFSLFLPAGDAPMVLEARLTDPAGRVSEDPRLAYDLYTQGQAGEARLDEDSAVAAALIREATQGTLARFVVAGDLADTQRRIKSFGPAAPQLATVVAELRAAAAASGLDRASEADRQAVTLRMGEAMIARLDLAGLRLDPLFSKHWKGDPDPALESLLAVLKRGREAATARLREAPAFFEGQPYLQAANAALPAGAERWAIRKPADLNRFVAQAYIVTDRPMRDTLEVLTSIGLTAADNDRLYAAIDVMIGTAGMQVFANVDGAKDEQLALVTGWRALVGR